MAATKVTVNVHVKRRGRLLDFYIDGKLSGTKDLTDFGIREEDIEHAIALLDEQDAQKAEARS